MCVEPAQLIGSTSTNCVAEDGLVGVEDGELFQEFFGFPQGVNLLEDDMASNGARYGGDEFNNRLVGKSHGVFEDAAPESLGCNFLLAGETAVEPIDQNVRIN